MNKLLQNNVDILLRMYKDLFHILKIIYNVCDIEILQIIKNFILIILIEMGNLFINLQKNIVEFLCCEHANIE